jgi:hypothetical protein
VVPVTNARYALNAVNARWGSLYDALYGTDALGSLPPAGPYDPERGAAVIAWARELLDDVAPLAAGSWVDTARLHVEDASLHVVLTGGAVTRLADGALFAGFRGDPETPSALLLKHHGLGMEIVVDREHPVGRDDPAGIADVVLESAVTTIMDLEDSVATVDAHDKVMAWRNWLDLQKGTLRTSVTKGERTFIREAEPDRIYTAPDGSELAVDGRSLMLVRNVGLLMDSDAVLDAEGRPVPGTRGLSLFLVPKRLPGEDGSAGERNDVVLAGLNHKMGFRGTTNCLLHFGEGRFTPGGEAGALGWRVGAPGQGLACMFHMMNEARIGVGRGAACLGNTGYLHALDYARNRPQGRHPQAKDPTTPQVPIIEHADVRRMLLAQKAYAEGGLALCLYCSRLVDDTLTGDAAERERATWLLELLTPIAAGLEAALERRRLELEDQQEVEGSPREENEIDWGGAARGVVSGRDNATRRGGASCRARSER